MHWAWELYLLPCFHLAYTTSQNNLSQGLISIPSFTVLEVPGEHLFLIHSKPTIFLILIYVHYAECIWLDQTVIYIPIMIKKAQQSLFCLLPLTQPYRLSLKPAFQQLSDKLLHILMSFLLQVKILRKKNCICRGQHWKRWFYFFFNCSAWIEIGFMSTFWVFPAALK